MDKCSYYHRVGVGQDAIYNDVTAYKIKSSGYHTCDICDLVRVSSAL